MSRLFILPYKMGSKGGKALANALGIKRLRSDGRGLYRYYSGDTIINWGLSVMPSFQPTRRQRNPIAPRIINNPLAVQRATNKLVAFEKFKEHGVPTCEFTSNWNKANEWLQEGIKVFARKLLSASQGRGIVICDSEAGDTLTSAPLYTKYFHAKREYRVHIMRGGDGDLHVLDFVKKGKRRERENDPNYLVRNHSGGWIFIRDGIELPGEVQDAALKAVTALGLDFGAVDIGYNKNLEQKVCIYEVNSSPGMSEGSTTLHKYKEAFQRLLGR